MPFPSFRRALVAGSVLGLVCTAAPAAQAGVPVPAARAAVLVDLTVTGPDGAVFAGPVATTGHEVTTASGGTHRCDGTNNGAHPSAGPTPTAALDDAAKAGGFTWDGEWYASFDDYFVSGVDGHAGGQEAYWSIAVNGTVIPVGGCQFRIAAGDEVAFTWTALG